MQALPSSPPAVERESHALTIIAPTEGALNVQQVLGQVALIQQVMAGCMKDGEHYGRIPGCGDKPTLLKPGAEKLCLTCRLSPSYDVDERHLDGGHREYRVTTILTSLVTDKKVGEGVGSCSTMEAKYRYRGTAAEITDQPVPRDYWDAKKANPAKAQAMLGGKGFTAKKTDAGWMIARSTGERTENPDLADQYNTVLKMAKKRALVDAVLTATAASDIFTQDLEDISANISAHTPVAPEMRDIPLAVAGAGDGEAKVPGGNKLLAKPTATTTQPPNEKQALSTRIHFGTNKGLMISELSPQQRSWYADKWVLKKEREGGNLSHEDSTLMEALKVLYPLARDQKPAAKPEDENQETTALLTNLGQLIVQEKTFTGDDLRDWLRTLMRGSKPILASDKDIEDLPASELESILKSWKKVVPDVTAFRKKREQQELLDDAPLN